MVVTFLALTIRIFSNPFSNVLQKKLATQGYEAFYLNYITFLGLSILCLPFLFQMQWNFTSQFWGCAILGGICGAIGNSFLVKALHSGELSVLGPINSYKCVVAMIFASIWLKEFPSTLSIFAVILVIIGSYIIFDTTEEKFSAKLLKRKDIQYRLLALVFTAIEAVFIKNVIVLSSPLHSFIVWCGFGMLFSLMFLKLKKEVIKVINKKSIIKILLLILTVGMMQISTNYVFKSMNVSYALALFQLSTLVSVIFGYKYFREKNIIKKIIGASVMVLGSVILILN